MSDNFRPLGKTKEKNKYYVDVNFRYGAKMSLVLRNIWIGEHLN